jgi:outer membrane protein TolC
VARLTLDQARELASQATANLQQARGRYESGVANILELIDAQTADATARIGVVRARFQLQLAEVRLLSATDDLEAFAQHH